MGGMTEGKEGGRTVIARTAMVARGGCTATAATRGETGVVRASTNPYPQTTRKFKRLRRRNSTQSQCKPRLTPHLRDFTGESALNAFLVPEMVWRRDFS
ncbi:hypothetical protein C8R46DRAFT_1347759 [Mycena filopes]|nr:hypothetical protein C8R46DRAFT_1347756 [Mycena filopes]KAJ7174657.1 hypothetical protein C8R46DRAFT_1347759 [Mycena filopes]